MHAGAVWMETIYSTAAVMATGGTISDAEHDNVLHHDYSGVVVLWK